jgi:hypothetical protein
MQDRKEEWMTVTMGGPDPRDEDPEAIKAAKARLVEELLDAFSGVKTEDNAV